MLRNLIEVGEYLRHILPLSASPYSVGLRQFLSSNPRNNQTPRQSMQAFLCVNTYIEMIDSALCKWTLCGFCRLMGLEPSQKRSTLWTVDVYPNLDKQPWDVALIYLICRHQHYRWTWLRKQHSSSTGDCHGVFLPGACAHERTTSCHLYVLI